MYCLKARSNRTDCQSAACAVILLMIFSNNKICFFPQFSSNWSEGRLFYRHKVAWWDSKWVMTGNLSPVTPREGAELLVGVGDCPSTENKQSASASFFTITSGPERVTGLQIPSSSSWACCLLNATWRWGKEMTIQTEWTWSWNIASEWIHD